MHQAYLYLRGIEGINEKQEHCKKKEDARPKKKGFLEIKESIWKIK